VEAANDAQNVRVDTACGKEHDQESIKMILWYRRTVICGAVHAYWWSCLFVVTAARRSVYTGKS